MTEPDRPTEGKKSPTYLLVQATVGQDTIEWLEEQRPKSWRNISMDLYNSHGLNVTEVTLRKWWDDAHPEPAQTPS